MRAPPYPTPRSILLALALVATPVGVDGQSAPDATRDAAMAPPSVEETFLTLEDGSILRYAIAIPVGEDGPEPVARPLVLALHPGGRSPSYGRWFMESMVEPALRSWGAVIVAPDVPDRSWTTPLSEGALLALVRSVLEEQSIDSARILVTGFSMGGRGSWYMVARHGDLFTGAIVMAGSPEDTGGETSGDTPLYLVHSPDDEVVPFEPVRSAYEELSARGRPVELQVLPGVSHYTMGAYLPALRTAGAWMIERWGFDPRW